MFSISVVDEICNQTTYTLLIGWCIHSLMWDTVIACDVVPMYRAYMQLISKVADIHRVYQDEDNRVQDRMDVR